MDFCPRSIPWLAVFAVLWIAHPAAAAITPEQRNQAREITDLLRDANRQIRAKNISEAESLVRDARAKLAELQASGNPVELRPLVAPVERRVEGVEKLLIRAGGTAMADGDDLTFTGDVAPILLAKCGNCHVSRSRGDFSMATFAALARGTEYGAVIQPGDSEGSRLIEVLRTGDMPRGGGRMTPEEIDTLVRWVDAGATFDGDDRNAPLERIAAASDSAATMRLAVTAPTGDETVLFSRDIAPVLVEHCTVCHGGNQPSARLSLDQFSQLLRGGNNGPILAPGKPDESLLVQKLRGTANDGARMPLRQPPLPDEVIAKFATWIAEGATFDGPDPGQSTEQVAQIYLASTMPHAELAALRMDLASKNWQLANPDEAPTIHETDNFLVLGNLPPARLTDIAQQAEDQAAAVARLLGAPSDQPLLKGRMTLFLFQRRYDYTEFGTMVERRDLDADRGAHYRYNIVDAYICSLPESDREALSATLAEQIAGLYLASLGAPDWFAHGSAKTVATRLATRSGSTKALDDEVRQALARIRQPEQLLRGNVPPGDAALLSYGLVKFLMTGPERYAGLLDDLRAGEPFDTSLEKHYGRDAPALVKMWTGK